MKTALMELIDSYEKSANQYLEMKQTNKACMYFNLAKLAKGLLAKEKEQIIDAYYGNIEGVYGYREAGEQYYNETYKNERIDTDNDRVY